MSLPRFRRITLASSTLTVVGAAVAVAGCSESPVAPAPGMPTDEIAATARGLTDGVTVVCRSAAAAPQGATRPIRYSTARFTFPRAAAGSGVMESRTLVVRTAGGDTLGVTTCLIPRTSLAQRLLDAVFARVGAFTTATTQRIQRVGATTAMTVSGARGTSLPRSGVSLDAPVCLTSGECATVARVRRSLALSIQYGSYTPAPPPPPVWIGPGVDCEYDMFYGCDYSNPNVGGGGGSIWDPPAPEADVIFTCASSSPACLVDLNANQRQLVASAIALFKSDAELANLSAACRNAAFAVRAQFDANMVFTGYYSVTSTNSNLASNGQAHLASTGENQTYGSPSYGSRVMHLESDFLLAVTTGLPLNGIYYTPRDLANVLLHEGMHLWQGGNTYRHGSYDTPPFSEEPWSLVNPQASDRYGNVSPGATACIN